MFVALYATAVIHLPKVFDLPYGELLGISSFGLILFGVGALPAGWLGDRWSQVGMLVIFFLGLGVGGVVTGLARDTTDLFIGLTLIGLFASIYHPVGIAWLVSIARKRGMTLGVNGVFGALGSGLAPVFVGVMIDWVSWRAAFLIPSALSIVAGLALAYCQYLELLGDSRSDASRTEPPEPNSARRVFCVLAVTMACTGLVYTGLGYTLPKLFELRLGGELVGSYTRIGLYVGLVVGFSSIGSMVGGWLADRYPARNIYIVFWFLSTLPVFAMISISGVGLICVAFLGMFLITGFTAAENMLVARYTPFAWRSVAYGAKFVLALGIGGLTVKLAGYLFDHSGNFDLLYGLFAGAALLATVAAMLLPKPQGDRRVEAVADKLTVRDG